MIEIEDLVVDLEGERVLDGVTLEVPAGTLLALIGPSGSGKTVLLKALAGLLPIASGSVRIAGEELRGRAEKALFGIRGRIGMLFQGGALFDDLTVAGNVGFPLARRGVAPAKVDARVRAELDRVRLAGAGDLSPSELSGGMRKRVGIARALIADPDVALYDEPTAGLDPVTSAKILAIVKGARDEGGLTGIAAGHELGSLLPACDAACVLDAGRVRYHGPVAGLETATDPFVHAFVTGEERAS